MTEEHWLPPEQHPIFVSMNDRRWPAVATRFKREKGYPPPTQTKGGPGWYFPRWWVEDASKLPAVNADALAMLRERPLATRAVAENWAPALIEFVDKHGREPIGREVDEVIARSRRHDAELAEIEGATGDHLRTLRRVMHETAALRLGFPKSAAAPVPRNSEATIREAEANLARLAGEANSPELLRELAPTPELLKSIADRKRLSEILDQ